MRSSGRAGRVWAVSGLVVLGLTTFGTTLGCSGETASDPNTTGGAGVNDSPDGAASNSNGGTTSTDPGTTTAIGSGGTTSTNSGGTMAGTGGATAMGAGQSSGGTTGTGTDATGTAGGTGGATSITTLVGDSDTVMSKGEFSFFAVSLAFIKSKAPCSGTTANSGKTCLGGLGGNLGGLDGADQICAEAAQMANPGDKHMWRAFLSVTSYNGGGPVNAIDRIGTGPWYTAPPKQQSKTSYASEGLLLAADVTGLLKTRPSGDTTTIVYSGVNQSSGQGSSQQWPASQCLLNENGYCTQADGDTHDTLTGTGADGKLASTDKKGTCDDWTNSTTGYGAPVFGHSWPRQLSSGSDSSDKSANWTNTGEAGEIGCGAIINVSTSNYMSSVGGSRPGGGSSSSSWGGGVGSAGGYGAFYCFAYVTGSE